MSPLYASHKSQLHCSHCAPCSHFRAQFVPLPKFLNFPYEYSFSLLHFCTVRLEISAVSHNFWSPTLPAHPFLTVCSWLSTVLHIVLLLLPELAFYRLDLDPGWLLCQAWEFEGSLWIQIVGSYQLHRCWTSTFQFSLAAFLIHSSASHLTGCRRYYTLSFFSCLNQLSTIWTWILVGYCARLENSKGPCEYNSSANYCLIASPNLLLPTCWQRNDDLYW
jgi:hypothetical protein